MLEIEKVLTKLGIKNKNNGSSTGITDFGKGEEISSISPVDGKLIGSVTSTTFEEYSGIVEAASKAFLWWRKKPAPQRGEIVRQYGEKLREYKDPLGRLVSYEMGKSLQEGLGEVQEMIDICDFAVGLSRQLHGLTMHSERPGHRMYEQYHPVGIVGIISAFNFPVAVWNWNTALAWVCGDVCIWKPSEKTPLCGIACQNIWKEVAKENNLPDGISCIINGDYKVGQWLTSDKKIPLISATGSTKMGRSVGVEVAKRFGKSLLELGGNNAIIVTENANIDITVIGSVFGAVGTCGQRCTSTRRLIVHNSIFDKVKNKLVAAYGQLKIGNPLDEKNHVGPLIDASAVEGYLRAIEEAKNEGGSVLTPFGVLDNLSSGCYVKPVIIEVDHDYSIVQEETFAPILYLMKYNDLSEAIKIQNGVNQGLSSSIMTSDLIEAETFLSASGSDCGIANVNIGTSGAEIGGAFGGEKETGGGRESGSDAWKIYMRRQTNTINYTKDLPLAQGIKFDI